MPKSPLMLACATRIGARFTAEAEHHKLKRSMEDDADAVDVLLWLLEPEGQEKFRTIVEEEQQAYGLIH